MSKKRIGIITLVHVRNIGAVLQAYAMQKKLTDFGCEVHFIKGYDFKSAISFFKGDMGRIRPWNIKFLIDKDRKFRDVFPEFIEKNLSDINLSDYDAIILGSDSIWIPNNGKQKMDTSFFGNLDHCSVSSYAASSGGNDDMNMYSREQIKALNNIRILTVRDSYAQNLVRKASGREARLVLDPTLLINWTPVIEKEISGMRPVNEPYLLVYGGVTKEIAVSLKKFADLKRVKLINIGTNNRHFEVNIAVSPFEYLSYIKNAEYIVTSMFHGVMLSLSLHKKFRYISMDVSRDKKISTSIEILGLTEENTWKWDINNEKLDFAAEIDYSAFESKRTEQVSISEKLLREMIGK